MTTIKPTLSSQITGNDYLSAYSSRMQVNDRYFRELATQLTKAGYNVYIPKDRLINWIKVENETSQLNVGFGEIPYRWHLDYEIDYTKGHGSGKTLKVEYNYNTPFTAQDVIDNMQPKVKRIMEPINYMELFTLQK